MTTPNARYYASALKHVRRVPDDDGVWLDRLDQARITDTREFVTFIELAEYVLRDLRYPYVQSNKYETYSWTASKFDVSERQVTKRGVTSVVNALWRNGTFEQPEVCVWIGDVDNKHDHLNFMTPGVIQHNFDALGIGAAWFSYTSYSHADERPKFRLVIDTSRCITRAESAMMHVWLDEYVLGGQGDASIHDPGDHVYAPPNRFEFEVGGDGCLDVEMVLAEVAADPLLAQLAEDAIQPARATSRPLTLEERAKIAAQLAITAAGEDVLITNPRYFRVEWTADYTSGASHWESMRSLLGRVWAKSGGVLSYGDMAALATQIDGLDADYFLRKYGAKGIEKLVVWTMNQPVQTTKAVNDPVKVLAAMKNRKAARMRAFVENKNNSF